MKTFVCLMLLVISASTFGTAPEPNSIYFPIQFWTNATISGELKAGTSVEINYERMRFKEIVDRRLQARSGQYSPGFGFASALHCYGYGCCEYSAPSITLAYRFKAGDVFATTDFGPEIKPVISIPPDAQRLEIYFKIEAFDVTIWYCGGGPSTSRNMHTIRNTEYDSLFGQNYIFTLK